MLLTPYQTTPCTGYKLDKIIYEITQHIRIYNISYHNYVYGINSIGNPALNNNSGVSSVGDKVPSSENGVYLITADAKTVPSFTNPIIAVYKDSHNTESVNYNGTLPMSDTTLINHYNTTFLDVRNYTKINSEQVIQPTSHLDFCVNLTNAIASNIWAKSGPYLFNSLGNFPMTVYSRWLSDQLSKRLALSVETQLRLTVINAFFFGCQFTVASSLSEDIKLKIAGQISRCVHTSIDEIMKIVDPLEKIETAEQYIAALKTNGQSIRFDEINLAVLYSIIGSSWFGFNKTELMAIALEYPPTFLSILYYATNNRGFKNTQIGQSAKANAHQDTDKQFSKTFFNIITE